MVDPTWGVWLLFKSSPFWEVPEHLTAGTEGLQRLVESHPLPIGLPRYSVFSRREQREQREALCWVAVFRRSHPGQIINYLLVSKMVNILYLSSVPHFPKLLNQVAGLINSWSEFKKGVVSPCRVPDCPPWARASFPSRGSQASQKDSSINLTRYSSSNVTSALLLKFRSN